MQGVLRIHHHGGAAGGVQGRGDLVADVSGLPDAHDDDLPALVEGLMEDVHRLHEAPVQQPGHAPDSINLDINHQSRLRQKIHAP